MPIETAQSVVLLLAGYAAVGAVFTIAFVRRGAPRLDPRATGSTWVFRSALVPGSLALWPWLAWRWWRAARDQRERLDQPGEDQP